jgi:hypothetical protein
MRYPSGISREDAMQRFIVTLAAAASLGASAGAVAGSDPDAAALERLKKDYADVLALEGTSRDEILAIARLLRAKPEMAIDRTGASGEYCLKSGAGTMAHYASDPARTREDIVYEFDAAGLTKAGLDPAKLPPLPALGRMEPGRWYYLPEGEMDPHHKHAMPGPTLLIAVDVR